MSGAFPAASTGSVSRGEDSAPAALGAVDWLGFLASPTFAIMALLTGLSGPGSEDLFCSAAHDGSALSGMVPMYLLMCAFHSAPWLKLLSGRPSGAFPREFETTERPRAR